MPDKPRIRNHKPNDPHNCLCHECVYASLVRIGGPLMTVKMTKREFMRRAAEDDAREARTSPVIQAEERKCPMCAQQMTPRSGYYICLNNFCRGTLGRSVMIEREDIATEHREDIARKLALLECEQEADGRWLAEIPALPGVMAYGATKSEAEVSATTLAIVTIAEKYGGADLWLHEDELAALLRPHVCQERIVFFPEEVLSLNDYQLSGTAHPFTCLCGADLVATTRGWICCLCNYTQDWAHTFMKDGSWRKMRPALPSAPLSLESKGKAKTV